MAPVIKPLELPELVWWTIKKPFITYGRKTPFVLLNGLAEQQETWFRNIPSWGRYVEPFLPGILVFDGITLQDRINQKEAVSVDYLVHELYTYIVRFIQRGPVVIGGSSTGAKIAVSFASRFPQLVSGLVLFGPAGLSSTEQLPIMLGVKRSDTKGLVQSVFYDTRVVDPGLVAFYGEAMKNRAWKRGFVKAIRGTLGYSVKEALLSLTQPILAFIGEEDGIVDASETIENLRRVNAEIRVLPRCGHAPHLEKPGYVNRETVKFLKKLAARAEPEKAPAREVEE